MDKRIDRINKTKEMADVITDRAQLISYLNANDEAGMRMGINKINQKYSFEKLVYDSMNNNCPITIQETAKNCISFLTGLLYAKGATLVFNELKGL